MDADEDPTLDELRAELARIHERAALAAGQSAHLQDQAQAMTAESIALAEMAVEMIDGYRAHLLDLPADAPPPVVPSSILDGIAEIDQRLVGVVARVDHHAESLRVAAGGTTVGYLDHQARMLDSTSHTVRELAAWVRLCETLRERGWIEGEPPG